MKKLTNIYKIKISIGIATGGCFTGLINIQGNRKMYSILGYKAIISRLLADKANKLNMKNKNNIITNKEFDNGKFIVYCDKSTVKHSQKWYRHNFVNDLYVFLESKVNENDKDSIAKTINELKKKNVSQKKETPKKEKKRKDSKRTKSASTSSKKRNKNIENSESNKSNKNDKNNKNDNKNENTGENTKILKDMLCKADKIYIPIEYDEYFFQTSLDPFPLIRTYKYNSHNRKQNDYKCDCYLNKQSKKIHLQNRIRRLQQQPTN
jgi:hypothetical protein